MVLKAKALNYATNCNLPTAHQKTHREHNVYTSFAAKKCESTRINGGNAKSLPPQIILLTTGRRLVFNLRLHSTHAHT
jgi:hypothetical protein